MSIPQNGKNTTDEHRLIPNPCLGPIRAADRRPKNMAGTYLPCRSLEKTMASAANRKGLAGVVAGTIAGLLLIGMLSEQIGQRRDLRRYPQIGRSVEIG